MTDIKLTINDQEISVPSGTTIHEAAKLAGYSIPILCHYNLKEFNLKHTVGSCRICVVEQQGRQNLVPSCSTPVTEGMKIFTHTPRVIKARRTMLQLLVSNHPFECLTCSKSGECELQRLCEDFGISSVKYVGNRAQFKKDYAQEAILREPDKCIMCRRCETACTHIQTVGVLSGTARGFKAVVSTFNHRPLVETQCTFCGQCVSVCPTGSLTSINCNQQVIEVLNHPKRVVVAQVAPAVRVALGELFGLPPGSVVTGKIVASLKELGFDYVFDTNWSADLTIVEEAQELINRIKNGGRLPILTSCCPGWVNFLEYYFPDLLDVPSTAKSPQQMLGSIVKRIWAEKNGYDPKNVVVVSIMPCIAKKYEAARPEHSAKGIRDVDLVVTTRELAVLLKESGIDLKRMPEKEFDVALGESTGAGAIFANAGGVLEAVLRTAVEKLSGGSLNKLEFEEVRGLAGVRETTIKIDNLTLNVAQASGLGNARKLLEQVRAGTTKYNAIEVMACPGGCIDGGGQPYIHGNTNILKMRAKAIYQIDAGKKLRKSHENPEVLALYKESLGEIGGPKAHRVLHTHYFAKKDRNHE